MWIIEAIDAETKQAAYLRTDPTTGDKVLFTFKADMAYVYSDQAYAYTVTRHLAGVHPTMMHFNVIPAPPRCENCEGD